MPRTNSAAVAPGSGKSRRLCLGWASLGVALALGWQFLTVQYNFDGNWTGLFYSGAYWTPPPELAFEKIRTFPGTFGYDGQFYHYIAHDPLLREGLSRSVDDPRLRWRRILIPGLASVFALGRDAWIDEAFLAVTLGFLFLGIYWSGCYCCRCRLDPAWGLGFALVPAAMISIERLTIDIALAALCVAFALYAQAGDSPRLHAVLLLAPFARETGLLLIAAAVFFEVPRKRWARGLLYSAAAAPYSLWLIYVHRHTPSGAATWIGYPFQGLWSGLQQALNHPVGNLKLLFAAAVHGSAICGVWLAVAMAACLLWRRPAGPLEIGAGLFALLAVMLGNPEAWSDSYAYGRFLSPLLIWLALLGISSRSWWGLLPLGLVIPRVAAQLATHFPGILSGLSVW